jgi:hypothetical protein
MKRETHLGGSFYVNAAYDFSLYQIDFGEPVGVGHKRVFFMTSIQLNLGTSWRNENKMYWRESSISGEKIIGTRAITYQSLNISQEIPELRASSL